MTTDLTQYAGLLGDIKVRIRQAQIKATISANSEMILMYWDIGRMILERQQLKGWGTEVIPRHSRDIRNDLPEEKGFYERNIKRMLRFYHEYPDKLSKGPQPVAQLPLSELSVEKYSVAPTHRQKGGTLVAHTTEKIFSLLPLLGEQIADLESETLDFQECPIEAKLRELPKVEDCYE